MKTPMVWKKLIIDELKIVTAQDIQKLAQLIGKDGHRSIDYLQRHGFIFRILKGIFYIKSPEERERNFFQYSIYEIIAMAMKVKGVRNWYFGLETAFKFNDMTHEYFSVNYAITDSYRTTKVIEIIGMKFQFIKWSKNHFGFGIIKKDGLRYSDKEKTVLDLAYKRFLKEKNSDSLAAILKEYEQTLYKEKLNDYVKHYPKRFSEAVGELL
jgi:predicted transcriptional regulator of viral defense system